MLKETINPKDLENTYVLQLQRSNEILYYFRIDENQFTFYEDINKASFCKNISDVEEQVKFINLTFGNKELLNLDFTFNGLGSFKVLQLVNKK
jgi:hypothetical protein